MSVNQAECVSINTAVLFLVFNRLDTTKQVFEAIRLAKPPRLYIAADGARGSREGDKEKVQAVRDYVMSNIDWSCEVRTLFREQNLGCMNAVSSAITWFFENEEMGIILEDDILPESQFFEYMDTALSYFKDSTEIGVVCGYNPLGEFNSPAPFLACYPHIWGWGTWKRVWAKYSVELTDDIDEIENQVLSVALNKRAAKCIAAAARNIKIGELNTWDLQFGLTVTKNKLLALYPHKNTVRNIGFNGDATHTQSGESAISFVSIKNLTVFSDVRLRRDFDRLRFGHEYPGFFKRVYLKFINMYKAINERNIR